ncbi:unnamed protein product [Hapterophycus canaliculatus]
MARTRGGGVISGASARPRRNVGKQSLAALKGGRRVPVLPEPHHTPTENADAAAAESYPGRNDAFAQRTSATMQLPRSTMPSERSGLASTQQGGNTLTMGTAGVEAGSFAMGIPEAAAAAMDGEEAIDFLGLGLEDLCENGIGIGDSDEDLDLDGIPEAIMTNPFEGAGDDDAGSRTANQSNSQRFAAVRKSPLSPPKIPVWRMLYVDPDVADPKLVAGLLEKAASQALGCACVFDVATDIVEALADVREDTMWVYRGVFINDSLLRHRFLKEKDTSIQGKHLSNFLRQAGMSRTRIILLVTGDLNIKTTNEAAAHGLSAVLRKPFTKTGLIDVLRGMYLGSEPSTAAAGESSPNPGIARPSFLGQDPCSTQEPRRPHGFPQVSASATAAAAAAAAVTSRSSMHLGVPPISQYPACLGFTPFTPMINVFHLGRGLLQLGQQPQMAARRKYAKIAPREEDEAVSLRTSELDGTSTDDTPAVADASNTAAVAGRNHGQEGLPLSEGIGSLSGGDGAAGTGLARIDAGCSPTQGIPILPTLSGNVLPSE